MEVMVALPDGSDFSFHSGDNSPYNSAPESPRRFNNYFFSAPTTPNYQHLNYDDHRGSDEDFGNGGMINPFEPKRKKIIYGGRLPFGQNNKVRSHDHFTIREEHFQDSSSSSSSRSSFGWLHKKWRLKDLLFRNASEAHETNKYDFLRKDKNGVLKVSSTTTTTTANSGFSGDKKNKERATLSAHERHYKVNRAAAEEMKKRTYLPYKQNLMIGCMNLDAASVSDPSRGTLKVR